MLNTISKLLQVLSRFLSISAHDWHLALKTIQLDRAPTCGSGQVICLWPERATKQNEMKQASSNINHQQ